jgi:hypothetical protein|tara:strand:+ start:51 stop:332 length:282 start_codon:yes stop_codon:yes gene_type:complete
VKVGDLVKQARKKCWATGSDRQITEMSQPIPDDQQAIGLVIREAKTIEDKLAILSAGGVVYWFLKNCDPISIGSEHAISRDKQQLMRRKDIER